MKKFVSVVGIGIIVVSLLSLLWPRITNQPRPEFLSRYRSFLLATSVGQQAATVLGVSNEASVAPFSLTTASDSVRTVVKQRVNDVILTHAIREISKRFKELPAENQSKVLEALTTAVTEPEASPSQDLAQPTQNSSNTNNNPGPNQ